MYIHMKLKFNVFSNRVQCFVKKMERGEELQSRLYGNNYLMFQLNIYIKIIIILFFLKKVNIILVRMG